MSRSKSSHKWLKEHFDDPFVKKAKAMGLRSRAAFKLIEIQEKDKLIKPGMRVIDLGAAPGGWSVLLAKWVGDDGTVIASDILPMESIAGVHFIQGDFREDDTLSEIKNALPEQQLDAVISDIAPNMSGNKAIDQPRAMYLMELTLQLADELLVDGGVLVTKLFQGQGSDDFVAACKKRFKKVIIRKPKASRARSKEVYLVAIGYNL